MIESLNHTVFLFINAGPDTPTWAIELGALLAKRVIYVLPAMLAAMWLWGNIEHRNTVAKALAVTMLALCCNQIIGVYLPTHRPFELGLGHAWLAHAATASFPSNHLTIFLGVGLCCVWGAAPRLGVIVLFSGAVVAWARVFVGVHFPLDMAGAIVVCAMAYSVVTPAWNRYGMVTTAQIVRLYRHVLAMPISAGWLRY